MHFQASYVNCMQIFLSLFTYCLQRERRWYTVLFARISFLPMRSGVILVFAFLFVALIQYDQALYLTTGLF